MYSKGFFFNLESILKEIIPTIKPKHAPIVKEPRILLAIWEIE